MHRIHFLAILICLVFSLISSAAANYDFANHPVADEDIYTGFIAELDTSNSLAAKFESEFSESLSEGANFAGKYRLSTIECGEQCQVNAIIDVSNGKVVDSMVSAQGVEFSADSRLVQINPETDFEYYLVWNENNQRFFRAYAQEVTLNDGRSCFWLGTDTNGTTLHLDGSNNIYGCDALPNVTAGTQASILKGTLYHDGGKPLGNFNADYMELKLDGMSVEIAQEKQVDIDIKQIRTQTGSCLKLDPIQLEPNITIYYLCDEGDDTHIVVLSNGFTQIGDALITEMIRLERDGENLLVSERLPVYIGLSAAGVDGVSESEKVSEVKPNEAETQTATEENTDSIEETNTDSETDSEVENIADSEPAVIGPATTDAAAGTNSVENIGIGEDRTETITSTETITNTSDTDALTEDNVEDTNTETDISTDSGTEISEEVSQEETIETTSEVVEAVQNPAVETIVEEIDQAVEAVTQNSTTEENSSENMSENTDNNNTLDTDLPNRDLSSGATPEDTTNEITAEASEIETTEDDNASQTELSIPDEATNPQTIGVTEATVAPILMAAPATQETIDTVTEMVNPTAIGVVDTEVDTETVALADALAEPLPEPEATTPDEESATEPDTATSEEIVETEEAVEMQVDEEEQVSEEVAVEETGLEETGLEEQQVDETETSTTQAQEDTNATEEIMAVAAGSTQSESTTSALSEEAQTAETEDSEIEINASNWQSHPDVVSTRMMYRELNEFIEVGLLRQKTQSFENCDVYQELDRKLWSDKGTARRYITSYGNQSGDQSSSSLVEHSYDDKGMLRYVYISEEVQVEGTSEGAGANEGSVLEHKIYYTAEGTLLWHDKQMLKQGTADLEDSKIVETITFNPELSFNAEHICD